MEVSKFNELAKEKRLMIDNYEKAMELLKKMENHIPIPIIFTKNLQNCLRQNNIAPSENNQFQIESVHYMGDEGGICCEISLPEGSEESLVISMTHLKISSKHILAKEVKSYQKRRIKKLARLHKS